MSNHSIKQYYSCHTNNFFDFTVTQGFNRHHENCFNSVLQFSCVGLCSYNENNLASFTQPITGGSDIKYIIDDFEKTKQNEKTYRSYIDQRLIIRGYGEYEFIRRCMCVYYSSEFIILYEYNKTKYEDNWNSREDIKFNTYDNVRLHRQPLTFEGIKKMIAFCKEKYSSFVRP